MKAGELQGEGSHDISCFFFLCVIIHFDVKVQGTREWGLGLFYEQLAQSRIFDPAQKATYSEIHWYSPTHPSIKSKKCGPRRKLSLQQEFNQQASILVGCVPPAFWVRGELGRCMVPGGGMVPGWRGGVSLPVNRLTDSCKNITFSQLRLRAVHVTR